MCKNILLVIFFLFSIASNCQTGDSIRLYLTATTELFKKESVYADRVNWDSVHNKINELSGKFTSYKEADKFIIEIFSSLKDHHGYMSANNTYYKLNKQQDDRFSKGILEEYQKPRSIKIQMLSSKTGYYKMPAVLIGSDTAKMKQWANRLSDSLCKLLANDPQFLIIDLRMNNGGNSVPMFEAFRPILGPAFHVYSADKYFQIQELKEDTAMTRYRNGGKPDRPCNARNTFTKIAVLIGPGTASSGEILAMALGALPNVKLFGERTTGVCNSTNGFRTGINDFYSLLTVSYVADYRKRINKECIVHPDHYVKSDDNYQHPAEDITVKTALAWLEEKGNKL